MITEVVKRLEDSRSSVRIAALEALGDMVQKGDEQVITAVSQRLEDVNLDVVKITIGILCSIKG